LTKICGKCKEEKPLEAFHFNKTCKDGRTNTCRVCACKRTSEWLKNNKEEYRLRINKRNRKRKQMVVDHFGDKCHDCEKSYPPFVYEFHHLDPLQKDINPSGAITRSMKRMWEELSKCIMLCSNCHKIRHHGDNY